MTALTIGGGPQNERPRPETSAGMVDRPRHSGRRPVLGNCILCSVLGDEMKRQADLNRHLNAALAAFLRDHPDTRRPEVIGAILDTHADAPTIYQRHEKEAAQ